MTKISEDDDGTLHIRNDFIGALIRLPLIIASVACVAWALIAIF